MTGTQQSTTLRLQILATSDLHMHVAPNPKSNGPGDTEGLHVLEPLIAELREADRDGSQITLLVDNGDLLQGTAMADYLASQGDRDTLHPVAATMNALDYDALGLGNHDLDFGLDYLEWFARGLNMPVLSSNLDVTPPPDWLAHSALITRGPLTIGIVSVMPQSSPEWVLGILERDVVARDMRTALAERATALRAEGADIVVALTHSGLNGAASENQLAIFARDGHVDALIGGHNHERFPDRAIAQVHGIDPNVGRLFGVPAVIPGRNGEALGVITLDLERQAQTGWAVSDSNARLLDAPAVHANTSGAGKDHPVARFAARSDTWLDTPVGSTMAPLTSYFSRLQPNRLLAVTAAAMMRTIDAARRDTSLAELPLIGIAAPTRAGGQNGPEGYTDIPEGPVSRRCLLDLAHFDDKIWAVVLSGTELRAWLERAASQFLGPEVGAAINGFVDPQVPAPDCDSIWGVEYGIDPTKPARYDPYGNVIDAQAQRLTRLTVQGRDVQDDDNFLAALTSYRAAGGGRFPGMSKHRAVLRTSTSKTDALRAVLSDPDPKLPALPCRFETGGLGLSTWIETGPGGARHLSDIADLNPGTPTRMPSGYLRIPIRL